MTIKKGFGIACCILAVLFAVVAVKNTFITPKIPIGDESGLGVSRMVGSFLPVLLAFGLGLRLFQSPKA